MGGRGLKYQTNESHGPFINHWGCNLCSIMQKVEKTSARYGKPFKFSNSDVGGVYLTAMRHGIVQKEVRSEDGEPLDGCTIYNGKALFNLCADMFSLPVECVEMRTEPKDYKPKPGEEEILELKRDGMKGSHFVSGNGKCGIEFDPIEGGSKCAKAGWIESKRIYVIKKR
jgi:hypothetical protein